MNFKKPARAAGVAVGSDLKTIPVADTNGKDKEIRLGDGKPTVLYVMSPECPWCAKNLENIRALARAAGSTYRFVGLSNTEKGLADHLTSKPLPFPVHVVDMDHLPKGFNATVTPQMVLVRPDGIVEKVWIGALQPKGQTEVENFFHAKLPGTLKPSEI